MNVLQYGEENERSLEKMKRDRGRDGSKNIGCHLAKICFERMF